MDLLIPNRGLAIPERNKSSLTPIFFINDKKIVMIKVLLVDDSPIFRKSVVVVLNSISGIEVIGECTNGSEVIPFLKHQTPDVILMDYQMPILNGIETTKLVNELFPEINVIGFSNTDDENIKADFLINGACGFLSKYEADSGKLVREISNC